MPDQCPQLAQLPENARKFWEEKQQKLADTLIRFSYAVCTIPTKSLQIERSGLLYLMKTNLWFEDFPKSAPFLFLFNAAVQQYEKTVIQMPLAALTDVRAIRRSALSEVFPGQKRRTGFSQGMLRFLFPDPFWLLVSGQEAAGPPYQYVFHDLDEPTTWAQALSELTGVRHGNDSATDS